MTTLELAEKIATAVIRATQPAGSKPYGDAPTQAVLTTLIANDAWLCKLKVDEGVDGMEGETHEELFERVQGELF